MVVLWWREEEWCGDEVARQEQSTRKCRGEVYVRLQRLLHGLGIQPANQDEVRIETGRRLPGDGEFDMSASTSEDRNIIYVRSYVGERDHVKRSEAGHVCHVCFGSDRGEVFLSGLGPLLFYT